MPVTKSKLRCYCVLNRAGQIVLESLSEQLTANALVPGTCYGYGANAPAAYEHARRVWERWMSAEAILN